MGTATRPLAEEIGRRLRIARLRAGIKQKDAAAAVPGLEATRLSNYEKGLRTLDIEIAKTLAQIYRVSPAYLLTLEDDAEDPDLMRLKNLYQRADGRGKQAILRTAEYEAAAAPDTADCARVHEPESGYDA